MTEPLIVRGHLATRSHPDSVRDARWELTSPAALVQLAEQAKGKIVTWNYDPNQPIGVVVDAGVAGPGVVIEIEIPPGVVSDPRYATLSEHPRKFSFGPGVVFKRAPTDMSDALKIDEWALHQVSVLPERPAAQPMQEALRKLCDLILGDMARATNRDLAADGPVGNEEGAIWKRIEAAATEARELL